MSALDKIAAERIPTTSPNAAIQHMRDTGWFEKSSDDYKFHIANIGGASAPTEDERELNYTFRYLVTGIIGGRVAAGKSLVQDSLERAKKFIANNSYVFAQPEIDSVPKLDAAGNIKPKKGAKKEMARKAYDEQIRNKDISRKDAIAILVEAVGLTPAGASTYYANLKKGLM